MNGALAKPIRGSALIERRLRRAERVEAERVVMRAVVARDGHRCRNPRCPFKALGLPVDPCHWKGHRGMGGNPAGDRTASTDQLISLCRGCHGLLDAGDLVVEPLTERWCDDPCEFYAKNKARRLVRIAIEIKIGVVWVGR